MSRNIKQFAAAVLQEVGRNMYGMDDIVRLSLVAIYTGGHVLLEGNPGLGKTELVKTLGGVLQLPFGRIQFTPDLMPADITGTLMPDSDNRLKLTFKEGPLFTSLLLADEINRATPKTQSAMLEAMAEKQVTVLGEKKYLQAPFTVLATQNPIDHEGTYELPEAQADRFMFKALMPTPDGRTIRLILKKQTGAAARNDEEPKEKQASGPPRTSLLPTDHDDSRSKFRILRKRIEAMEPLPSVEAHVLNMFLASNGRFDELVGLDRGQIGQLKVIARDILRFGLGPRAAIALMLAAKAWSLLFLPKAEFAEGAALAKVAIPTLRHRVKCEFDWEDRFRKNFDMRSAPNHGLLERMLEIFCRAAAPKAHEYQRSLQQPLRQSVLADLATNPDNRAAGP